MAGPVGKNLLSRNAMNKAGEESMKTAGDDRGRTDGGIYRTGLTILVTVVVMLGTTDMTTWMSLGTDGPSQRGPDVMTDAHLETRMKDSDNNGIMVDLDFPDVWEYKLPINISGNITEFDVLEMNGTGRLLTEGNPSLPSVTRYVEVPHDVGLSLETVHADAQTRDGYWVCPNREPAIAIEDNNTYDYTMNETTYTTDGFYPSDEVSLETPFIMRGHRVAPVVFHPIQFNPVSQQIKVFSKMEVRVNYNEPTQIIRTIDRLISEPFEELLEATVLNYKRPESLRSRLPGASLTSYNTGDYLVITDELFEDELAPLIDWKDRKGLGAKLVTTQDIDPNGASANEIAAYIKNAYDTWTVPPTYVLLVGDADFIPTHYRSYHEYDGIYTASDLYYATVDGDDLYPDIFVGRYPVGTESDARNITGNILMYETTPPFETGYFKNQTICSYFEDKNFDRGEDWPSLYYVEEVRDYLRTQGYRVQRVYTNTYKSDPAYYFPGSVWHSDSEFKLPDDLLIANGFKWDGFHMDILRAIEAGSFLVGHLDHGDADGWCYPPLTGTLIDGVENFGKLTVLMGANCRSGWFDDETDGLPADPSPKLCEKAVLQDGKGAIAAVGATRVTYIDWNYPFFQGFYDAVWTGLDGFGSNSLYSLGQMLTYAKIFMAMKTDQPNTIPLVIPMVDYSGKNFEEYTLFGDPETAIWTQYPTTITVDHPAVIGAGATQELVVRVTKTGGGPAPNAKVCLRKPGDFKAVRFTDPDGFARFTVTSQYGGNIDVTVTRANIRPYTGEIVSTYTGTMVDLEPDQGATGEYVWLNCTNFVGNELIDLSFGTATLNPCRAANGVFRDYIQVPEYEPKGYVNVIAKGRASSRVAVTVFRLLPGGPLPDPFIYAPLDPSTWYLNTDPDIKDPTTDNPCIDIVLNSEFAQSIPYWPIVEGFEYKIKARVYNNGHVPAEGTTVTFRWAQWGTGQVKWQTIGKDVIDVPTGAGQKAVAKVLWTPIVSGHVCILVEVYHPYDSNLKNNKGQENMRVESVGSPGEFHFTVENPTDHEALAYLEVDQRLGSNITGALWGSRLDRDYPQVLGPYESQTATLTVFAPDEAPVGEARVFTVTSYIDDNVTGAVELRVVKDTPPMLSEARLSASVVESNKVLVVTVKYTDKDGHGPMGGFPAIHILNNGTPVNGSPWTMLDPVHGGVDFSQGIVFSHNITGLPPSDNYTCSIWNFDALCVPSEPLGPFNFSVIPSTEDTPPVIIHTPPSEVKGGSVLNITASVHDDIRVISTELHYRRPGEVSYSVLDMVQMTADQWTVLVPGSSVRAPGIEYYIVAMDAIQNVTFPVGGESDPIQIVVTSSDTTPPIVAHDPPIGWRANMTMEISADVTDDVAVLSVVLYHRPLGTTEYTAIEMAPTVGPTWAASIPGGAVTPIGLEYYVWATDGPNEATYPEGGASSPVAITDVIVPDVENPKIEFSPPDIASRADGVNIAIVATDDQGISGAILYYRMKGDDEWRSIPMTGDGDWYNASVPSKTLKKGTMEYYIVVTDINGNTSSYGSSTRPLSLQVEGTETTTYWISIAVVAIIIVFALIIWYSRGRKKTMAGGEMDR